jgi:hypothetical protein
MLAADYSILAYAEASCELLSVRQGEIIDYNKGFMLGLNEIEFRKFFKEIT